MIWVAVFAAGLVSTGTAQADNIKVGSLRFAGNETFPGKVLLSLVELKPPFLVWKTEFTADKLLDDTQAIAAFYHGQGFLQASVRGQADTVQNEVNVTVHVDEGVRTLIDSVRLTPNPVLTDSAALHRGLLPGAPLIYSRIDTAARAFGDSLAEQGYLAGRIVPHIRVDSAQHRAAIEFTVRPGPRILVKGIDIRGLRTVKNEIVRRQLTFRPGDTLAAGAIRTSQRRLYITRLFNYVKIAPAINDSLLSPALRDTMVPVVVTLEEADFLTLDAGIGYGSYQYLYGSVLVSYANLFHRGHILAMNDSASAVNQWAQVIYSIPWFFGLPLNMDASIYYRRHDAWLFDVPLGYTGAFYGFTLGAGRNLGREWAYRLELDWENVIRLDIAPGGELPPGVRTRNTASLVGDLLFDRRDDVFDPVGGYLARFHGQWAGLAGAGSNQFVKTQLGLSRYWSPANKFLLSSGFDWGWARPYGSTQEIPPQDLFYAGGSRSVRGFDYEKLLTNPEGNPLGGNVLLVLHLIDFQFPLVWRLRGAVFSDAGYLWQDLSSVNPGDLRFTAGPGLRLTTPIGLFRLDAGFQLQKPAQDNGYAFYFDYGAAF